MTDTSASPVTSGATSDTTSDTTSDETSAAAPPAPLRVAVLGAGGRMGRQTVAALDAADDLRVVARLGRGDDLAALLAAVDRPDVVVDFTVPDVTLAHVLTCVAARVHVVVGTTGWDDAALDRVRAALADAPGTGVVVAPNFALSAVLTMHVAALAAPWFESVEVVELHHPDKLDAPSGTARHTAAAIAAARAAAGVGPSPDATVHATDGARGADVDGVRVHAVRLRGLVAHEEVLLGNPGEQLTIRTDTFDRSSFMPGVLLAVRQVGSRPGLTVGLEHLLGLVP
ncbi:4-hydroxy-tetrahydrodipicolinate reductase [Cellulomonas marina]|uniref:4-hydroxy-tetrahydrodipicolinate reductase n=1 Tax=Cellulomonas marina TaxID=988821 RepID=A0A1I0VIH9_9CELL|nr:4-hydroxy-tetrahydrodipicolinate reductase [Cellulomonas marina]GIG27966.1 4-hydroxy-tetrahydrodipicolinate reductase [Cellulomonas marina]SFA75740.1 4-hydroxy-tetrahydrodipicolinate reductase [Cellulomonas marina]